MMDVDPDFEALENQWERLFLEKRWQDLVEATITAKIELSKRHAFDSRQVEVALGWLRLAIGQVEEAKVKNSPECSFCGKKPPAIKLGAGPSAFICNECVALFTEVWREDKSTAELLGDNASQPD